MILYALALAGALPLAASEYKWIGQITEDGAALSYAVPESDAIKIDFHCDRKTKKIVINYDHEPKESKNGMKLALRLSNNRPNAPSVHIPAVGQRLELDDRFVLQGETRMTPQLRRILSEEGVLAIAADTHVEEISLKGVTRASRQLFASCP